MGVDFYYRLCVLMMRHFHNAVEGIAKNSCDYRQDAGLCQVSLSSFRLYSLSCPVKKCLTSPIIKIRDSKHNPRQKPRSKFSEEIQALNYNLACGYFPLSRCTAKAHIREDKIGPRRQWVPKKGDAISRSFCIPVGVTASQ